MEDPALYIRAGQLQFEDTRMTLDAMGGHLRFQPHDRILDLGCGPGNVTRDMIASRTAPNTEIIGLDVSENMIEYARENYQQKGISYIHLDAYKVGTLKKYYPLGFSHVLSFFTFHWLINYEKVLEDLHSMLRDDGTLFLVFIEWAPVYDAYRQLKTGSKFSEHMKGVENHTGIFVGVANPPSAFAAALDRSGFVPTDVRSIQRSMTYRDTEHALTALKAVNPWKRGMSPELENEFVSAVLAAMKPSLRFGPQGEITVGYSIMAATASPKPRTTPLPAADSSKPPRPSPSRLNDGSDATPAAGRGAAADDGNNMEQGRTKRLLGPSTGTTDVSRDRGADGD